MSSLAAVPTDQGMLFDPAPFHVRTPVLDLRQTSKPISAPEADFLKAKLGTNELVEFKVFANPGSVQLNYAEGEVRFVYHTTELIVVMD